MTMMRRAPRVLARSAVLAVVAGFVPLVATPSYGNAIPSGYRLIADAGSAASEGTIFTSHDDVTGSREIVRRDQDGSTSVVEPNGYDPEVSPDGQWLVFKRGTDSNTDHGDALYTQQLAVGPTSDTLLVSNSDYIVSYDISPDSTKVLYDQTCDLYITNIDSTGSPTDLGQLGAGCYADSPAYDPADPTKLAYDVSSDSGHGIFIYNTMTSTSTLLAGTGAGDFDPEWSADGSKIAYSHLGAQIGST
ncbi:MAG TPA: hypothetical protein VHE83_05140, partial [Mycobacteriales bacterium]|nr:hypothetical protein [Mycobacteriales bacterium]